MLPRAIYVLAGFLAIWATPLSAQIATNDNHGVLKNVAMSVIIAELNRRDLRVAFVEDPALYTKPVHPAALAANIELIPASDRTWVENLFLQEFLLESQKGTLPNDTITGNESDSYSITLPDFFADHDAEKKMLADVVALDPRNQLVWFNDFPVICPKNAPIENTSIDLAMTDQPALVGLDILIDTLTAHNIRVARASLAPYLQKARKPILFNLVFSYTPLMDALCHFTKEIGPNYTWALYSNRTLLFSKTGNSH